MALLQISEPGQAPDPHQRRIAVGIDLGTTHSLVAAVRNGVAECLPDAQGRVLLPSVVRYLDGQRPRRSARRRVRTQADDAAQHHRLGQALHGPRAWPTWPAPSSCPTTSSTSPAWWRCARARA